VTTEPARREFCTLFDSNYLVKAVAMYDSLERHCPSFRLTAFCFDTEAEEVLARLRLPQLETVSLAELESAYPSLLAAKPTRSAYEYYCTSTPSLPLFMFDRRPELGEVTYIDSDLFFFGDPAPLFEELGDGSVLIIPHRFPRYFRHYEVNGVYNVQFLTFRRDENGLACLRWWHDRCIEWCYFRLEEGKFADQKYLDEWPRRFDGVHVLRHKGGGLAPWNVANYELRAEGGPILVDEDPLVFFHFHRVRMRADGRYDGHAPGYVIPRAARRLVYEPYFAALDEAKQRVRAVAPGFSAGLEPPPSLHERVTDARAAAGAWLARLAPRVAEFRYRKMLREAGG
jgi:hypothetical protein